MDETIKLIAQTGTLGGVVVVSLYFLGRVVLRVADRMIAAIDRVGVKIDEHTEIDTKALSDLKTELVTLRATITGMELERERTPVGSVPLPMSRITPPPRKG